MGKSDLQLALIIEVSAAGAASAMMMNDGQTVRGVCVSQLFVCLSSSAKLLPTHIPVHQSIKHCVNQSVSLYQAWGLQILLMMLMLINLANVSLSDAVNGQANRLIF